MPRTTQPAPQYLLQEPTTGLYIVPRTDGARLTGDRRRAGFRTRTAAIVAASEHVADQPHELVRVDA